MWVMKTYQKTKKRDQLCLFLFSNNVDLKNILTFLGASIAATNLLQVHLHKFSSVQFSVQLISASRPSTEHFIRNTGTGSDGRSCHLSHCPHKFMQNNKIQMTDHGEK